MGEGWEFGYSRPSIVRTLLVTKPSDMEEKLLMHTKNAMNIIKLVCQIIEGGEISSYSRSYFWVGGLIGFFIKGNFFVTFITSRNSQ